MYVFQVVIQNSKPAKETADERKLAKGWKGNIDGDEAEEKFFNKLRKTLQTCNVKNTLVINGWKDTGKGGGAEREHDFVIISDPLKTVFLIEVKQNKRGRKSATQQLQSGMEFFNESLVLPEEEKWKFIRIMYFDEKNVASSDCSVFVFTPETDLYDWWKGFEVYLQEQKKLEKVSSLNEHSYIQNCKFLLHQMFQQSQIITEADLSKSSEEFIKKSCNTDMQINETDIERARETNNNNKFCLKSEKTLENNPEGTRGPIWPEVVSFFLSHSRHQNDVKKSVNGILMTLLI